MDAAIGFGIYKMEDMIKNKDREIRDYIKEMEEKSRGSQNLKEVLTQVRQTKATMSDYERFLFRPGKELDLITDLEKIAVKNKTSLKIESSNLDKITNNVISLALRFTGNYGDVLRSLADLENYDYFLQITSIDFNPIYDLKEPESAQNAKVDLRLTFKLYVNQ
jgi:transcriptional regulator of heat shock response